MTVGSRSSMRTGAVAVLLIGALLLILSAIGINVAAFAAQMIQSGRTLSPELSNYYTDGQRILGLGLLVSGVALFIFPPVFERFCAASSAMRARRFEIAVFTVSLAAALLAQTILFDNIPHVTDAISHDFQARLIKEGRIYAPLPPCPDAFFQHHFIMTLDGKWFSKYTPGHPLVIALGYLLHAPILPIALCHALSAILLFRLVRRFFDDTVARMTAVLFTLSPLATLLAASFMSHTSFLFMVLAGTFALVKTYDHTETKRATAFYRWGFVAGFFWGWALLNRPQDAAICGLMVVTACVITNAARYRRLLAAAFASVPGLLPPIAVYLLWNYQQYGVLLTVGYGFNQNQVINRVYQASFGLTENFTFRDAFRLMAGTLYRFDRVALGWPLTIPFCLPTFWRHRFDRRDVVCAAAILIHAGVYFFYDYYGLEYEARYYFNLLPFVLVLLVRSLTDLSPTARAVAASFAIAFTAHSALNFWPSIVFPTYGPDYEQAGVALHRDAVAAGIGHAVVLIDSTGDEEFRFSSGMIRNNGDLDGDIVFARRIDGKTTDCLRSAFVDRTFYMAIRQTDGHFRFNRIANGSD